MRVSHDEKHLLAAFAKPPLCRGMHSLVEVMRAAGEPPLNPARRAAVERLLRRLTERGAVRRLRYSDGVSYFMRVPAAADRLAAILDGAESAAASEPPR